MKDEILKLYSGTLEEKLEILVKYTEQQLKNKLSTDIIPEQFNYIISDVARIRLSRLGSEGYSSEGASGMSISYLTASTDFEAYKNEIDDYLRKNNLEYRKGKIDRKSVV